MSALSLREKQSMTNAEQEGLYFTAIKLLKSSDKTSTDQLYALLEEALAQKSDPNVFVGHLKTVSQKTLKQPQKRPAKASPAVPVVKSKKLKSSSPSSSPETVQEAAKSDPKKEEKSTPKKVLPVGTITSKEIESEDSEATDVEEEEEEEDERTDAGKFAAELGIACVVCNKIDVAAGNQLVECTECHNLYHQECHKPPITDRDVSDPRNIWYCVKCKKNMEKISKKSAKGASKSPTSSASFQSAANIGRETAFQLMKAKQAEKESTTATIQPFKRIEMKLQSSSNGSSGNSSAPSTPTKPTGLAGFAASISRTTASSSSSSTSNSSTSQTKVSTSSKAPTTSASLSKADKRIAQMKKKASSKKMLYDK